jgi:hypothetical protein
MNSGRGAFATIILTVTFCVIPAVAQTAAQRKSATAQDLRVPRTIPAEMLKFLVGDWEGDGEFSSGKKIEAEVSFTAELDSAFLLYRHTDRPPNRYKALGTWGVERDTGKFIMLLQDNFGGSRRFESDGWANAKIVFLKNVSEPTAFAFPERFTFERLAADSFKMTYEANRDGRNWKIGDYIVFHRKLQN